MNRQDAWSNTTKHPFRGGGSLPFHRLTQQQQCLR